MVALTSHDGEDRPLAGDAFELDGALVGELEIGANDKIADGRGNLHLVRSGQGRHAGADVIVVIMG